jgi:hypothetical protein
MLKNLSVSLSASIAKFRQGMADAVKVSQDTSAKISSSTQKIGDSINQAYSSGVRKSIDDVTNTLNKQKAALRDAQSELASAQNRLATATGLSKKEIAQEKENIRLLKSEIRDLNSAIRSTTATQRDYKDSLSASRLAAEDNSSAIEATSRAVNAASSALLLLTNNNKELQPFVKGLTVAMAALNAVVAIQNLRLRDNQVITNLMSRAQNLYTAATTGATVATTAFKRALVFTGIGAVIVGIVAIASSMGKVKDATEEANKAIQGFSININSAFGLYDKQIKKLNDLAEVEEKTAEVRGASDKELTDIRISNYKKQLSALDDLSKKIQKQRSDSIAKLLSQGATPQAAEVATYNKFRQSLDKIDAERAELQKKITLENLDLQLKTNEKIRESLKKTQVTGFKDKSSQIRSELQLQEKQQLNAIESQKNYLLQSAKTEEEKQLIVLDAEQEKLNIREFFLNEEFKLNSANVDAAAKLNVDLETLNNQRIGLENQKSNLLKSIREKELNDQLDYYDTLAKYTTEWQNEEFDRINKGYDQQELAIKQSYANGLINAQTYNKELQQLTIERLNAIRAAYISFGLDVTDIEKQIADATIKTNEALKTTETTADKMSKVVENAFNGLANGLANALSEGISAIISGKGGLNDLFNGMLMAVGNFLQQLGSGLIAAAIATQAFYETLVSNPPAAIAFGIAAVAAGAAIKATLSEGVAFANGGIVSGPTLGLVGEYPGASTNPEVIAPLNKLKGLLDMGNSEGGYIAETRVSGRDLAIVLNRYNNDAKRI